MPVLPSLRVELASDEGREALSGEGGAENGDCVDGEDLEGYFLAVAPAAVRLALEVVEPIVGCAERWKVVGRNRTTRSPIQTEAPRLAEQ
jgi:hypothetical protein